MYTYISKSELVNGFGLTWKQAGQLVRDNIGRRALTAFTSAHGNQVPVYGYCVASKINGGK